MVLVAMGFCGLWGIVLSPNRLSSYPRMYLAWVVTISVTMMSTVGFCGLWGIVLSPDKLSSYPRMYLAWVVTIPAMAMSTIVFSCQRGLVMTPSRRFILTSPGLVLVETKLFNIHAFFTLGRGYHN